MVYGISSKQAMGVRATISLLIPVFACKGFVEMRIAERLDRVVMVHCEVYHWLWFP
jgi:hypothetical protein